MTEALFILTTIFVAYVVYTIIDEQKATIKSKLSPAKPEEQAVVVDQPKTRIAAAKAQPAVVKVVTPKAAAAKAAPPKAEAKTAPPKTTTTAKPAAPKKTSAASAKSAGLKNPLTGDVATTYSNYRFTKRWIKDALVAEGLLEKVYANNELNAETDAKIKIALGKLESLDKYKV